MDACEQNSLNKAASSLFGLFLLCASVALWFWWPSSQASLLNYDDPVFVGAASPVHKGLSGETLKWSLSQVGVLNLWHPLTWISFLLESSLLGSSAKVHHLGNLLLHAANAGLVSLLARRFRLSFLASLAVGLLFALHPSAGQSVLWISERKGLLSTFFILLSLLSWDSLLRAGKQNTKAVVSVLLCTIAALLSKPIAVVLPALFALQTFSFQGKKWQPSAVWKDSLRMPFFAASALTIITAAITLILQQQGGLAQLPDSTLWSRLSTLPAQLQFYSETLIGTSSYRLLAQPNTAFSWVSAALCLGLIGLGYVGFQKRAAWALLIAMALVPLLPVCGIVPVSEYFVADRYFYLGRAFAWIALFCALSTATDKLSPAARSATTLGIALLLLVPISKSTALIERYQSSLSLFTHEASQRPSAVVAHLQLAHAHKANGQPERALAVLANARQLHPSNGPITLLSVDTLYQQGDYNAALDLLKPIVFGEQKSHPMLYLKTIGLLNLTGQSQQAKAALAKALQHYPAHPQLRAAQQQLR